MAKLKEGDKVVVTDQDGNETPGSVWADATDTPVLVVGPDGHHRGYPIEWVKPAPTGED